MKNSTSLDWHPLLLDPNQRRSNKPRTSGKTMVMDKGLGLHAMEDLLLTASAHVDMIKIGFGTSALYPKRLLQRKIELAHTFDIPIYPGGTFLEIAVARDVVEDYFIMIKQLGFSAVEISDGTIELHRTERGTLIEKALEHQLIVFTEYGKKGWGSEFELEELIQTVNEDIRLGAELVTIEGREAGEGVGIYDEHGDCRDDQIEQILAHLPNQHVLLWEAPQKAQQVHLLQMVGADINLGNIHPQEVFSLEALRRGLRADTFQQTF